MNDKYMDGAWVCKLYDLWKGDRGNWEQHWEEATKFCQPKKQYVNTDKDLNAGEKRDQNIYDATAVHANELLASALHSMLTNPSIKWFDLTTGDAELDKNDNVRLYLQKCSDIMFDTLNNSNFNTEVHEYYLDLPSLGTGFMYIDEHPVHDVYFKADTIYNQVINEDKDGIVNSVIRKLRWDASQLVGKFGVGVFEVDKGSDSIKTDFQENSNKKYELLHAILPVDENILKKYPKLKTFKFASFYVMRKNKKVLEVKGFKTFPACASRWTKLVGEIYGRSPAMKALPDIKMLNKIMYVTIKAAEKVVDPPMLVPDDGLYHTPDIRPGGINYYRPGSRDRIETMDIKSRPEFGIQFIERLTVKIERAFFIDQLQLREGPQMTATEVIQRTEENLRLMGPILGRQNFEFLRPLIDRVFSILERKRKFPEPPEELKDNPNLRVQFSSMIAQAQKLSQIENVNRAIGSLAPMMQIDPEIMDNLDTDKIFDFVFDIFNLPQDIKRSAKEVKILREERAAAQEEQMRLQKEAVDSDNFSKTAKVGVEASKQGLI